MTVNFMGLTGPSGVLPRHYTERLFAEVRGEERHALRDWLDLFNHRLVSLFTVPGRNTASTCPSSAASGSGATPTPSHCLYSLVGLGFPSHRRRFHVTHATPLPSIEADAESVVAEQELARLDDTIFFRFGGLFARVGRAARFRWRRSCRRTCGCRSGSCSSRDAGCS